MSRRLKILFAHGVASPAAARWYANVASAAEGIADVRPFCLTLDAPGPRLTWLQLDDLFRRRDRKLMAMYERLREAADDCDVLLNYNGINIHPEILDYLPTFNVFGSFDDPEATDSTSRPVAAAFDAAFHGNIASRPQYEAMGCDPARLAFLPIFVDPTELPDRGEREALLNNPRPVPLSMCCEYTPWRAARLDALVSAFPDAQCYGSGWPNGRIEQDKLEQLYRQTQIGWNLHNSTGPINQRTFMLAAWGVLQICDNRVGLSQLYQLGDEAIGFDSMEQAIELTRHYLSRPDERRRITANAFDRFWADYHPKSVWQRIVDQLTAWDAAPRHAPQAGPMPRRTIAGRLRFGLFDARERLRLRRSTSATPPKSPDERIDAAAAGPDQRVALGRLTPISLNELDALADNKHPRHTTPTGRIDPNALCWAVATLLGPARRVAVHGSLGPTLVALLANDPTRDVRIHGYGFGLGSAHGNAEVCVLIDGDLPVGKLIEQALDVRNDAPRMVIATTRPGHLFSHTADNLDLTDACHWLADAGSLALLRMKDPTVPWLTPCDEPAAADPWIVHWTQTQTAKQAATPRAAA